MQYFKQTIIMLEIQIDTLELLHSCTTFAFHLQFPHYSQSHILVVSVLLKKAGVCVEYRTQVYCVFTLILLLLMK